MSADDQLVDVEDCRVAKVKDEVMSQPFGSDEERFRLQHGEEFVVQVEDVRELKNNMISKLVEHKIVF